MSQYQRSKYDLLGSFKLLLLQLEADDVFTNKPLRKLPLVCCPCHTFFSFSFLSVSICVYALYSFLCLCICVCLCMRMSHQCWTTRSLPLSQGLLRTHCFTWLPQARCPHNHSQQPLPKHKDRAKYSAVEEQRERQDCKLVNIMLYSDTY